MFFWRAKKVNTEAAAEATAPGEGAAAAEPSAEAKQETAEASDKASGDEAPASNVVTLQRPRLSDRLAQANSPASGLVINGEAIESGSEQPDEPQAEPLELQTAILPGQERALEAIRFGLAVDQPGFNVLVIGPSGTGRRTAVRHLLEEHNTNAERQADWIYVSDGEGLAPMRPFNLPAGRAAEFTHAVDSALARASVSLQRLFASDDYAIGLQVLEEEFKQAGDQAFDALKRRAELQNIALVKTPEGYVLAPMHDGRVVKSDVFHALPDQLQKDVEKKIIALEAELKDLIAATPAREAGFAERLSGLNREVGARALHPAMSALRSSFTAGQEAGLIDGLEAHLLERIAAYAPARSETAQAVRLHAHCIPLVPEEVGGRPVVFARDVATAELAGETARNASGRPTLRPGHLMRANGGYLVLEAWRLVACPQAWETLSAALETGSVKPKAAGGELIEAEALPLCVKIILIADEASWAKLVALDPGIAAYFPAVARFNGSALSTAVDDKAYVRLANAIARAKNVKPLDEGAAAKLRAESHRRSGSKDRISLDISALSQWIVAADHFAAKDRADTIRPRDVEQAMSAFSAEISP
jgi:hypothetical protein